MSESVYTDKAPKAIGPYSQGICAGGLLFVSGQLPIDPVTNEIASDDIRSQTRQSLNNIGAVLSGAGLTFGDVVKSTVYLSDMNDFAAMNEVYGQFFSSPFPTRMAFQAAALARGAKVEIEVIASKQG